MNAEQLRQRQAPLKATYEKNPGEAIAVLAASGDIDLQALTCRVELPCAANEQIVSGLHPRAGGEGSAACSGDMLLQSLVACSGVTFAVVSTAMEMNIASARIEATGRMDFRGTLGVSREIPVGLTEIELLFEIESDEPDDKIERLIQLTERYCVVLQSLTQGVSVSSRRTSV